jgi:integrase
MARQSKRLAARFVSTVTKPGMYADGDGLYLVVESATAKRWAFVFQWHGRRKEMGLGPVSSRSLADAREAATEARRLVAKGVNPIEARAALRAKAKAGEITFGDFADKLVDDIAGQFRNAKHLAQWRMTLTKYAAPLRSLRPDEIDTAAVLGVLKPLWQSRPETASRLRMRIERVLDGAKVAGYRTGDNPARWRGHLDALLPKRQRLTRGHHAAMPYQQLPAFMSRLATVQGMGAKALRFLILQVKRTSEVVFARWPEIDLEAKLWVIPPERMKGGREHREPLTKEAVEILRELYLSRTDEWVFPGFMKDRPISTATMTKALRLAGGEDFTVHGFRSSFRDWAGEETSFPREIAEAALAHVVGDETERAYRRGDALAKRRKLMEAWERYCLAPPKSNVVPFVGGAAR